MAKKCWDKHKFHNPNTFQNDEQLNVISCAHKKTLTLANFIFVLKGRLDYYIQFMTNTKLWVIL